MNTWYALKLLIDSDAVEAIEFGSNELEVLGTEINNLGKLATPTLTLAGYFNEKPDDEALRGQLNEALSIYGFPPEAIHEMSWEEVGQQDWLAEWKKHWKPTVTDRFIIAPMWERVENTDKWVIRIEPSMAFGTGTHETTRLCLAAIEKEYDAESFLDVGTGTGILAIAALMKAKEKSADLPRIVGCDTDVDSIKIAIENAEVNDATAVDLYVGSIDDSTDTFDFVCANLTADVITPLLPLLTSKAAKKLVLSGILVEQCDDVLSELKVLGVEDTKVDRDGEWVSILVKF
jgi:ribosomal protein L11 methyltransferase